MPSSGALITEKRDENSKRRQSRQNRSSDFWNFWKLIFDTFYIDIFSSGFFYPESYRRSIFRVKSAG